MHIPVDKARGVCTLPWGTELAMAPFFGVMGVAPPPAFGTIGSKEPRLHGGNIDNKHLTAGSTLFLPVWVPGACFSAGDGHGIQGDGEVCVTALEMCLDGTFTFVLHKGGGLRFPRAETPDFFISMGMHEDLDQAMKMALREMIAFICTRSNLSREQAYQFCSLAVDFHVTQSVNGEKGVHGLLRKGAAVLVATGGTVAGRGVIRHAADYAGPRESFDDPARGDATWRTLFSNDRTATSAMIAGMMELDPRGGTLAAHTHPQAELYFVASGTGVMTLGDEDVVLAEGTAVFIPGNVVHAVRNDALDVLRIFYVFATDSFDAVTYTFGKAA